MGGTAILLQKMHLTCDGDIAKFSNAEPDNSSNRIRAMSTDKYNRYGNKVTGEIRPQVWSDHMPKFNS